ncbi:hypothetical protein BDA99DRAFT_531444 [Phascolomyces articulosus]|uniref:DUF3752 domain-containing protein n=1 Tax=Phascolomyces articulosus TaxID=60185 RepID=A0AAD5PMM5_9FUNG|nr:hypothetical protein BDA99DRAFT_531444 [Phascolomyces articulosus]
MIGPDIPKHLLEKKKQQQQEQQSVIELDEADADEEVVQDVVRDNDSVGPSIPPELLAKRRQERSQVEEEPAAVAATEEGDEDPDAFAPALPPDLLEARKQQKAEKSNNDTSSSSGSGRRRRAPAGPALPSRYDNDDDEYVVGPSLPTNYNPEQDAVRSAVQDIEERAKRSKEAMEAEKSGATSEKKVERPEWMLLPPEVDFLRGADSSRSRGFSSSNLTEKEKDRSVWTDTPADKERRRNLKRKQAEEEAKAGPSLPPPKYSRHEQELKQNISQHNMMERPKSLVELHREQGRKNRKKETEDVASRPFDREKDLLNGPKKGMDKRQKQELLKSARELGGRFGSGSSSFL